MNNNIFMQVTTINITIFIYIYSYNKLRMKSLKWNEYQKILKVGNNKYYSYGQIYISVKIRENISYRSLFQIHIV